jgi:hypothetical protein
MALTDSETSTVEGIMHEFIERRRPAPQIRHELDLGYRLKDQSVEVFELRPFWKNPQEILETKVAKATYVRSRDVWRIFWLRKDLKWHRYDPRPEVKRLEEFVAVVDEDRYCCFFG